MLCVDKRNRDFPEYDYETASVRDAYNAAAIALENSGLVSLEWAPNKKVISVISLNLDRVVTAYAAAGRTHPKEKAEKVIELLETGLDGELPQWISLWKSGIVESAKTGFRIPGYCRDDLEFFRNLINAFAKYSDLKGEPITERGFSIRCFHDSKKFEREISDEFLRIARQHDPDHASLCEEQEHPLGKKDQLAYLGIYARPELIELSGKCTVITSSGLIPLSPLYPYGFALPGTVTEQIKGIELGDVNKILFIENKTNYDEYLTSEMAQNELVIYHGGFLSPQKRRFLSNLLGGVSESVPIYFWADIDLGGFKMFMSLKNLFPRLFPMRMSSKDVEKYRRFGLVRKSEYFDRLKALLNDDEYAVFKDSIREILKFGVTIEQEVFLSEYNL